MKLIKAFVIASPLLFSNLAMAVNDVYGVVGDIFYRTSPDDNRVYFRLNGGVSHATLASCMGGTPEQITWDIDLSSPVGLAQLGVVQQSRELGREVRILGKFEICDSGQTQYGDGIFEIVPR